MWVSIPNRLLWADQNIEAMYAWLLTALRATVRTTMSSVEMDEWEWDGQAGRGVGGMPEGPTAEEGRGERRNVDGELQASYEPSDSEWGNPRTRNRSHRRLNL
jgi:hypothetical protein